MIATLENVYVDVPQSDMTFFAALAERMGWMITTKDTFLSKYINSRPMATELSEEDIMAEVKAVRYKTGITAS